MAYDRFHPLYDMHTKSEAVGPLPDDKLPWLNTIDEVGDIVRTFSADLMKRQADDIDKQANGEDRPLMKWLIPECDRLNGLFFGITDEGYKTGPWNAPDQLGHSLIINYGLADEEQRLAVRNAFMVHAGQVIETMNANIHEAPEQWAWQIEALVDRLRNALLGIPVEAGDLVEPDITQSGRELGGE